MFGQGQWDVKPGLPGKRVRENKFPRVPNNFQKSREPPQERPSGELCHNNLKFLNNNKKTEITKLILTKLSLQPQHCALYLIFPTMLQNRF